ncbi:hypothetical protein [Flagellimonas iocasae]|uniref:Uncharacterized protein n=1 Tax=Flagellimonas iocasae TaxID=2055905 RepID=A0ABW4Y381_9FLAO
MKSTNEHGVHSPFVFNFVTQCLYSKQKLHSNKSINVLLKSIGHFKFRYVEIDNIPEVANLVKTAYPAASFDNPMVDLFYTDSMDISKFIALLSEGKLHNDSMILVEGIHRNKQQQKNWENLITSPNITVSIDMFHCGAIFIREEQVKEHFIIRI